MTEEEIWDSLIKKAEENVLSGTGGPFAAMIVRNGEIIATGTNTVTSKNDPTAHAEVNAIRRACLFLNTYQLNDCIIYSSCEPCPMCLGACYWARVGEIKFCSTKEDAARVGFDDSFIYDELNKIWLDRKIETEYCYRKDGKRPFDVWKNFEEKKEY